MVTRKGENSPKSPPSVPCSYKLKDFFGVGGGGGIVPSATIAEWLDREHTFET